MFVYIYMYLCFSNIPFLFYAYYRNMRADHGEGRRQTATSMGPEITDIYSLRFTSRSAHTEGSCSWSNLAPDPMPCSANLAKSNISMSTTGNHREKSPIAMLKPGHTLFVTYIPSRKLIPRGTRASCW